MVSPDRSLLQAMVETDETEVPLRSKHDPIKGYGIPNVGKLLIIGAVELSPEGHPRRVRLEPLRDRTGENVRGFVERVVAPDATVVSDPVQSGDHERFVVKATTGETLEIDHNVKLATYVPAHAGDKLIIHGKLYVDPGPKYGVHCTHAHTSGGCPMPGWIEFNNTYYE